jgi:hypothetical protein
MTSTSPGSEAAGAWGDIGYVEWFPWDNRRERLIGYFRFLVVARR